MSDTPTEISPEVLQAHPILMLGILCLLAIFLLFSVGTLSSWAFLVIRRLRGEAILPVLPWQPRKWGLIDLLVVMAFVVISQVAGVVVGRAVFTGGREALAAGDVPMSVAATVSAFYIVSVVVLTAWIMIRYNVSQQHVGFTSNLPRMLKIGLIAGVAFLPLVYLGNALVSLGSGVEYDHPLLKAMQEDGYLGNYLFAVFAAAIGAPIAEEFLFRVIIQGWLQSIPFRSIGSTLLGGTNRITQPYAQSVGAAYSAETPANKTLERSSYAAVDASEVEPTVQPPAAAAKSSISVAGPINSMSQPADPFSAPPSNAQDEPIVGADLVVTPGLAPVLPPLWPSFVAGILFGLAHWGYGLSFIPLSVFGIYLGLLYRATQSIWPCIIVHFMMNGSSMLAMGVMVYLRNVSGG